jgi:Rab proteins geranylgeranyltransferase component A
VYTRSRLLACLVSSKAYQQLEFQAVGSWWIYRYPVGAEGNICSSESGVSEQLYRVPSSREDIFADQSISIQLKRKLVKFLRHISQASHEETDDAPHAEDDLDLPFSKYLALTFQIPSELHAPLLSLSLSQSSPEWTPARFAVPRIRRHLASIGVFGPGFGSLLAKWGGGSEIAQVGCRALAVGGGVYALNREIQSIDVSEDGMWKDKPCQIQLPNEESIRSEFVVGSRWDLPTSVLGPKPTCHRVARCITIASSSLRRLFLPTSDDGRIPAGAVVTIPGATLRDARSGSDTPPVYLLVHSNETGECPAGQCKFDSFTVFFAPLTLILPLR